MSTNAATQAQFPAEITTPAPVDTEFLDSPFLRWVKLADMLLSRPRSAEEPSEFSN